MNDVKLPLALVAAMLVQIVAATWYFADQAHKIELLTEQVYALDEIVLSLERDNASLITFATFTENKWREAYHDDMTYVRQFGTKPVDHN